MKEQIHNRLTRTERTRTSPKASLVSLKTLATAVVMLLLSAFSVAQENSATCTRTIAVATTSGSGTQPYNPDFINHWWKKNAKKYPSICFSQTPKQGASNFLLVVATDTSYFNGVNPKLVTSVDRISAPHTVNGTAFNQYGSWSYSSSGTVTTTTTTTVLVNVPYTDTRGSLFMYAYSASGALVASASHLYSTRQGSDASSSVEYNLVFLIAAAGARGRMLARVTKGVLQSQPTETQTGGTFDECNHILTRPSRFR